MDSGSTHRQQEQPAQSAGGQPPVAVLFDPDQAEAQRLRDFFPVGSGGEVLIEPIANLADGGERLARGNVLVMLVKLARDGSRGFSKSSVIALRTKAPQLPLIVLVSAEDKPLAQEAMELGASDYLLIEHLDGETFLRALRYVIEYRLLQSELEHSLGKLQANQANFQNIIESQTDGVLVLDQQGLVCFTNRAAESLLRQPARALLNQPFSLPVVAGQTQDLTIPGEGDTMRIAELRVVDTLWEGERANLVLLHDVTERRKLERLKDEFVAMVSHELRTPLTSVKGGINLMLKEALGQINPEQRDFLHTIHVDLERLTELITNLLDLSKIEAGRLQLTRQLTNLADLIEQSCKSHQALLGQRTLIKRIPTRPMVYVDANRILQVLGNLLGNAIKFTKPDGQIGIELLERGHVVQIAVTDNGPGIAKKDLPRLFHKFEQLRGPQQQRGTGLGLAISKEIIELHGGEISAQSDGGHGSCFLFTLPIHEPIAAFTGLFQEAKDSATAEREVLTALMLDFRTVRALAPTSVTSDQLDQDCFTFIRKHVAAEDRIIVVEPGLYSVLALTSETGSMPMAERLRGVCSDWGRQLCRSLVDVPVVSAVCADGGGFAVAVLQQLMDQLPASNAPRGSGRKLPHG